MSYRDGMEVIGFGWSDALQAVHGVGKGVLSMFGAGAAGDAIEDVYKKTGVLPSDKPSAQGPAKPAGQATPISPAVVAQWRAAIQREDDRIRAEEVQRKKAEDKSRFWTTLVAGTAFVGLGVVAWKFLSPTKTPQVSTGGTP